MVFKTRVTTDGALEGSLFSLSHTACLHTYDFDGFSNIVPRGMGRGYVITYVRSPTGALRGNTTKNEK